MTRRRLIAAAAAVAIAGLGVAGLAGWAILVVLVLGIVLGLMIIAAELVRPIMRARREVAGNDYWNFTQGSRLD